MNSTHDGAPSRPQVAPFAAWLGLYNESAAAGCAVVHLTPRQEMCNRHGVVHGGVLASLLDSAMARASRTLEGVKELGGTTDLHVQFMRPAAGPLRAQAWIDLAGGTLAFCRAEVRNAAAELVATGSASIRLRR
ncbi:PaaI family thioesterase [Pantoea sp. 18069]|uniref:PaaI family thioesterase n=1 Tax=Pantoea sp. 18069 TaxID=2681415 RepID=UPI0013587786|nr:PaaI family thioesterase [Pantoea sp. 18069]